MTGVLVDSDIFIEVLRGRNLAIARQWDDVISSDEPLFYSPVTLAEVRHGMRPKEREFTERAFSSMMSISIGAEIGARAGDYLRAFQASHAVELGDALIAATACINDLRLWTQNRKHFPMKDVRFFTK